MANSYTPNRELISNPFAVLDETDGPSSQPNSINSSAARSSQRGRKESPIRHVPGYDAHFEPPLDKKLECPICLYALRDPIQTSCGHRFCRSCIEKSLAENKMCPVDKRPLSNADIFPDNWCRREVMCLNCECRLVAEGCAWVGQLKDFEDHLENDCLYALVTCPSEGCTEEFQRRELENHLENSCTFRIIVCHFCGKGIPLGERDIHNSEKCPKFPRECPQNCGEQIPRCELDMHVANHCTRTTLKCQFPGCDWEGFRIEYDGHKRDDNLQHFDMMREQSAKNTGSVTVLQEDMLSARRDLNDVLHIVDRLKASVGADASAIDIARQAREKLVTVTRQVDQTIARVGEVESRMVQLERKAALEHAEVTALSDKLDKTTAALQKNIASLITIVEQQNAGQMVSIPPFSLTSATAKSLSSSSLVTSNPAPTDPAVSYDGTMVWKIMHWKELRAKALEGKSTSVYSSPFYTALQGYKVRVRVYPNGDGMGKANSLSVFFTLCRGEFDAVLPWPFRSKVTFTLLDQSGAGLDIVESFVPDSSSNSFQKPRTDMNIASGCPLFAPLVRVQEEGSYVLNDTIMIKVSVEARNPLR